MDTQFSDLALSHQRDAMNGVHRMRAQRTTISGSYKFAAIALILRSGNLVALIGVC